MICATAGCSAWPPGAGSRAPLLAAAGATVTVLDISDEQLARDRFVADRDGLNLRLVQGRMDDLSAFGDGVFDLIVNPPSTLFVPDLAPIWRECHRVLRPGGHLLTAFANPDEFVFDPDILDDTGQFVVRNRLPWAEADALTPEQRRQRISTGRCFTSVTAWKPSSVGCAWPVSCSPGSTRTAAARPTAIRSASTCPAGSWSGPAGIERRLRGGPCASGADHAA